MSQPATSASGPRVLYLVHRFPYPPNKGDRIRAFHIIRYLASRCRLSVATLADEPVAPAHHAELSKHCERLEVIPLQRTTRLLHGLKSLASGRTVTEGMFSSRPLRKLLRSWIQEIEFDSVLVSSSSMIPYLHLPELQQTPAVVDLVDVDSEKWLQYAQGTRSPLRWLYRTEGRRLRRLESQLPASVRAVTLVSRQEADFYQAACGNDDLVKAVTNGVDLEYFSPLPPSSVEQPTCVFVGVLDYPPNVAGVEWFCRNVWPRVRERWDNARFWIVGRRPSETVRQLASRPGVSLAADVPDVRPYLQGAWVVVAPLKIARGVQNKVLEAMACGRPVLATPEALTGLNVDRDRDVVEAAAAEQWVQNLHDLFAAPARRTALATAACEYVEEHHDWESCLEPFDQLLGQEKARSRRALEPLTR